jgi:hypothetical protein
MGVASEKAGADSEAPAADVDICGAQQHRKPCHVGLRTGWAID